MNGSIFLLENVSEDLEEQLQRFHQRATKAELEAKQLRMQEEQRRQWGALGCPKRSVGDFTPRNPPTL